MTDIEKYLELPFENAVDDAPEKVVLRLDKLRATPANLRRIRRRVEELNEELRGSGAQFRLRLI